jgi:type III pantothenate kinase
LQAFGDPPYGANLLIVEIGNSHLSVASLVKDDIWANEKFPHTAIEQAATHAREVWDALPQNINRAAVAASVVPGVLKAVEARFADLLGTPLLVVGEQLRRPISLAVQAPESVGSDRVCCAAAAFDRIRNACVTASFGTAITIDCVNDEGVFMGGAILPGLTMQACGLHRGTAQLPEVEITEITTAGPVYGATTEQAIRIGIICGAVGALREITERYATDLHKWPQLVVTGGNAELIKQHCEFVDDLVPDLCLRGIALAYRKHFEPLENNLE